jgi:hypothetical protein
MPIPDNQLLIAEIVVRGTQAAAGSGVTPAINVYHYRRTAVAVPVNRVNLKTAFWTAVGVPLLAAANVRYTPNIVSVRFVSDATEPYTDLSQAGAGAIATDSEPSDDAVFCYLKTAVRMPGGKGGKHFAGTSEVDTTGDILTGAGLARWQAVRDSLILTVNSAEGNSYVPCVLSRKFSQLKLNPTNVVTWDVVASLLDLNIGTMRRRRSKTVR